MIWLVAIAVVLLWPPADGTSLLEKAVHFAADPLHRLPVLPPPLPLGLGDDADAVAIHDAEETEYYRAYERSALVRLRIRARTWTVPIDRSTVRQLLVALVVVGALSTWRLAKPDGAEAVPDSDS